MTIADNESGVPPRAFAFRMALLYSLFFAYIAMFLPYFPLWLKNAGLGPNEIALVLSLPMLVRIATSGAISAFADRTRERANVLIVLMGGSALCVAAFPFASGFWPLLAIALVMALFNHPLQPVMDSITLTGVRRFGFDYGRIRLWGSAVFIAVNLAGGWILSAHGIGAIMLAMIGTACLGFVLSPLTPRLGSPKKPANSHEVTSASTWKLMQNRKFMLVTAGCGIVQASHAMFYGFGSIHFEEAGYSGQVIGLLWGVGVLAEIVLFQFSRRVLGRITPVGLAVLGAVAAVLRWAAMALQPGFAGLLFLQALHGLSFGATHLGLMHFYASAVPDQRMGAAQAAGFVTAAVAMGLLTLASGALYAHFGVFGFLAMTAASVAGLALLLMAQRLQPQSAELGGETFPPA